LFLKRSSILFFFFTNDLVSPWCHGFCEYEGFSRHLDLSHLYDNALLTRGVARIFQRRGRGAGGSQRLLTIRGSPTIYGLYRCSPSCISGLSRMPYAQSYAARSAVDENTLQKTNLKKVGFSAMAFTAKILSWRFRHLNIVDCLLKRRPTRGGGGHGHPRTPPSYAPANAYISTFNSRLENIDLRCLQC